MASPAFALKKEQETFELDALGGAGQAGTWTTNEKNQIVIQKNTGPAVAIDVAWRFNSDNQLIVSEGDKELLNFGALPGFRSSFQTRDGVLLVKPDRKRTFEFTLRAQWSLDAEHDLLITVNGQQSKIDGFINDPSGRFLYLFSNKKKPLETNVLGFVGGWGKEEGPNGEPKLSFTFKGADGANHKFVLPGSIVMKRSTNQLAYSYNKRNKTLGVQLQGTLLIDSDFRIRYVFDRQKSASGEPLVNSTMIGFAAEIVRPNFQGDLELVLKREDGTNSGTTLAIGGSFSGVLGQTTLLVGFAYSQTTASGGAIRRSVGFDGQLQFQENEVVWSFETTGQTLSLEIGAHIKLGEKNALDGRLNLQMANGEVVGVTALLGVRF
ncbi:MAG: hypothetical protein WD696_08255 [Bryobacteraceae bacterium]